MQCSFPIVVQEIKKKRIKEVQHFWYYEKSGTQVEIDTGCHKRYFYTSGGQGSFHIIDANYENSEDIPFEIPSFYDSADEDPLYVTNLRSKATDTYIGIRYDICPLSRVWVYESNSDPSDSYISQLGYVKRIFKPLIKISDAILNSIAVTSQPTKASYAIGENISYDGIVVTASYADGLTTDVTSDCTFSPSEGKAFDPATDATITISYTEDEVTKTQTFTLLTKTLDRIEIASLPWRSSYKVGEAIRYYDIGIIAYYSDNSTEDVSGKCTFSPAAGKAFDPATDTTVTVSYTEDSVVKTQIFNLTAIILSSIEMITQPSKTSYMTGDVISYSGIRINASYSNESISNVTSKCTFSPVAGKAFDPTTDTTVTVSYTEGEITRTLTFPLVAKNFNSLLVTTLPTKISYKAGEVISYDGIIVTASYSDGSTSDVSNKCTFSPVAGKTFDPRTDVNVSVSYVENNITHNCTFTLAETTLTELTVKPARTSFKSGEAIRYLGTVIKAVYSDNSTEDVTSKCTFSPAAGKAFNPATDTTVTVNYTEGDITQTFSLTETVLTDITIVHQPKKKEYREGDVISYNGLAIRASYSDSSTKIVTNECVISPVEGKAFDPNTDTTVTITYTDDGVTKSQSLGLKFIFFSLDIANPPTKTSYTYGEAIDYSGLAVIAVTQSEISDVTNSCIITPAEGKAFDPDTDTTMNIVYTENDVTQSIIQQLTFVAPVSIAVTSQPNKTTYMMKETIDYTGLVVTATYSDNTTQDVTRFCSLSSNVMPSSLNDATIDITFRNLHTTIELTINKAYHNTVSINDGNVIVPDGEFWHITGSGEAVLNRVIIGDGAFVEISDITIILGIEKACIDCLGDAYIILDGDNKLIQTFDRLSTGDHTMRGHSCICISGGHTLIIDGTGSLDTSIGSNNFAPAIGHGHGEHGVSSGGDIIIKNGNIIATGGEDSPGIGGGGYNDSFGDITIIGGSIIAKGADCDRYGEGGCPGIGGGTNVSCGNITIKNTVTKVTATKGEGSSVSIGAGYKGTCGTVTIEDGANVIQN